MLENEDFVMKMTLKLADIFMPVPNKWTYTKQELLALLVRQVFMDDFAKRLNLDYVEQDTPEGNLCFANNQEVLPAYRTTFGKLDIVHYIVALLSKQQFNLGMGEVPFPENADAFWAAVNNGSQL